VSEQNVVERSDCILWEGTVTDKGYGWERNQYAHRKAYERAKGQIPPGLQLDHLCRNRRCVNPDHLEPVTRKENILRGESFSAQNARKTHCERGHELTPENTYMRKDSRGGRQCKTCRAEDMRRYRRERKDGSV